MVRALSIRYDSTGKFPEPHAARPHRNARKCNVPLQTESAPRLGENSLERIGNTPLLRLERMVRDFPDVQLLGKAEWYNPGGSVKDRAAFNIVTEGRRQWTLRSRQDPARFHQR